MEIKLCERLLELRRENGLTQKQVADVLNITSVAYLHYEKGQREPSVKILVQLAGFYQVTLDYLVGLSDF